MNKKYLLFAIPLFALTLVMAVVLYGSTEQEIEIVSPIEVVSSPETITAWLGQQTTERGEPITITNIADIGDIEIEVSNNAPAGIEVMYLAKLEVYQKDVDWNEIGTPKEIYYTLIGNEFVVESDNPGYMVINYLEPSDPYTGIFKLPTELTDSFSDEKFWLVPDDADMDLDNHLDSWNAGDYYFEHDVVSYTKGNSGIVILKQGETLEIIPVYTISSTEPGTQTITTSVTNIE